MKITFVKKILKDGSPCAKCADVQAKLNSNNQMQYISKVAIADERDENSEGMVLAKQHNVERAPFFVVERTGQATQIYTVYLKFVKEIIGQKTDDRDEAKEILQNNSDLDFL